MKIKLILILFIISSGICNAQWILQPSGTTNILRDVEMVNENTGWICGDGGIILKTTNGGENWINVPNPASGKPLFDIDVVDANTMYCVGWFETILKSTNGGDNWFAIRNGQIGGTASYYTCSFINKDTGWICGDLQKILRTTNGGISFDSTYIFIADMFEIYFKNSFDGLLTGEGDIVKRSTDGGINWYQANINLPSNLPGFEDFCFINQNTGFMPARDGRIFKTTDFGNNWDTISRITFTNEDLRTIDFVNSNTGFVGGTTALLYSTTNGGYNWTRENIGFLTIRRLRFVNDTIGWVVGTSGRIYKTTTGGDPITGITNNTITFDNFELSQNYPNPFNNSTLINYSVRRNGYYKLEVFNIEGKLVKELFSDYRQSGSYSIRFESSALSSGVYFYRLSSVLNSQTKKFLLIK
ncbi:MAG: T9SS type A sorting domain-containing protein [Ignavibacteriae bacterium]|nr:T9SS type A sorting domain-containing protein [Ignavibacteriota bacterium]MCB0725180.1 T9SS type A sorting domain-containing protein [Ignavibacteriota bacterium]MCB9242496.1 T9SS type A sorting domain-containing protein [Ignavibacteriales bacterium]